MGSIFNQFAQGAALGQQQSQRKQATQGAKDEKELRRLALEGGKKSEAYKQLLINNPKDAMALQKHFGTDSYGVDAMIDDSLNLLYQLEADPTGGTSAALLKDRGQNIPEGGRFHTDNLTNILTNQGPQALKENLLKMHSVFDGIKSGKPKEAYQKGDKGLVFNPNDGTYSMDPTAKARFDEIASKQNQQGNISLKDRQSINKDVTGFIKQAISIKTTAEDLKKLKKLGTGAASISAIFKFMKANDPTSTVREGEFATAETSGGVPEAVRNFYNKIVSGERIDESEVQKFIDVSEALTNSAIDSATSTTSGYINTFEDSLPKSFSSKVLKRVPSKFKLKNQADKEKLEAAQAAGATQEVDKQGGQIMTDANGNRAMVFPDGSFKEL